MKTAVGVIVVRHGRVLMGLRAGGVGAGTWGFPGGEVEDGETAAGAALRELEEETGLKGRNPRPVTFAETTTETGENWLVLFVGVDADGQPELCEPEKCRQWQLVDWDAPPGELFHGPAKLKAAGWTPLPKPRTSG